MPLLQFHVSFLFWCLLFYLICKSLCLQIIAESIFRVSTLLPCPLPLVLPCVVVAPVFLFPSIPPFKKFLFLVIIWKLHSAHVFTDYGRKGQEIREAGGDHCFQIFFFLCLGKGNRRGEVTPSVSTCEWGMGTWCLPRVPDVECILRILLSWFR